MAAVAVLLVALPMLGCQSLGGLRDNLSRNVGASSGYVSGFMGDYGQLLSDFNEGLLTKEEFTARSSAILSGFGGNMRAQLESIKESIKELPRSGLEEVKDNSGSALSDLLGRLLGGENILTAAGGALLTLLGYGRYNAANRRRDQEIERQIEREAARTKDAIMKERNLSRQKDLAEAKEMWINGPAWMQPSVPYEPPAQSQG